jgi:hypothetical protein
MEPLTAADFLPKWSDESDSDEEEVEVSQDTLKAKFLSVLGIKPKPTDNGD